MMWIWVFLRGMISRNGFMLGSVLAALLAGFGAIQWHAYANQEKGRRAVVERSIEQGKAANETSEQVREAARRPGAFERLLRDSCRDCD